jgi:uncharacterized membrane protein
MTAPPPDPPGELTFNRVSGRSPERIAGLSDALFAIAMTLLIIELSAPAAESVHNEGELWRGLLALSPRLLMYAISFMTLGIFWVGQQALLHQLERSDRHFTWINLAFLATIALFPFSTALMAEFLSYRVALGVYWLNILLTGIVLYAAILYAERAQLLKPGVVFTRAARMMRARIVLAQALYAMGAALCVINTSISIAIILLVQINYAVAPAWRAARTQTK